MEGFAILASGSKGNATYLGTKDCKLLIDVGISLKRIETSLATLQVKLEEVSGILITHEHHDHIASLETLVRRYPIPIYANSETAKVIAGQLSIRPQFKIFTTGEPFLCGDIEIHPFSIPHDTVDPVAFTFSMMGYKLGLCTDLGFVTSQVVARLRSCDYLIIESNHEVDLVYASNRPLVYKKRVLGRQGHLSNEDCKKLLEQIQHPRLKTIFLAHLSSECNTEELALKSVAHLPFSFEIAKQEWMSRAILFAPSI